MQDERFGLRFAAIMMVGIAAFLAVMSFIAYQQSTQIARIVAQIDAAALSWLQLWLVPVALAGGAILVFAIAIGFWRAAQYVTMPQPYQSSTPYQTSSAPVNWQTFQQSPNGELDPNALAAIKDHIANDRIIQAVKLYREVTGVGLREARDAVLVIKDSL